MAIPTHLESPGIRPLPSSVPEPTDPPSIKLDDILFIIVNHRWKLILSIAAGFLVAGIIYFKHLPEYESEAKLLVRYVVDKSSVDASEAQVKPGGFSGEALLSAETDIITSWDLIQAVAESVTVEKLFPGPAGKTATMSDAVMAILAGLKVTSNAGRSSVIVVSYKNHDPELARTVLNKIVTEYFERHLKVHRSAGSFDFVSQQTDQVRARLSQSEEDLKRLKAKAGITSTEQARTTMDSRIGHLQTELDAIEAERAEQQARLTSLAQWSEAQQSVAEPTTAAPAQPVPEDVERYGTLLAQRKDLYMKRSALRARYTNENKLVKMNEAESAEVESNIHALERKWPTLKATAPTTQSMAAGSVPDIKAEQARMAAILARGEVLRGQMKALTDSAQKFSDVELEIGQLERRKSVDEKNYEYFQSSLEKARIDEALDPSKMPNISMLQTPTPAMQTSRNVRKLLTSIIGGGFAVGIAWVLFVEFILDPSVKRASELQARMGIPLLHSIPYNGRSDRLRLPARGRKPENEIDEIAPPLLGDAVYLQPYFDAVRDRLILFFELNNLFHMPKLVAVTGCGGGAGTSTVAGGLAAALAKTGDGKVLLVDMNRRQMDHPLFEGRPSSTVTEALRSASIPSAGENLYLATAIDQNDATAQMVPRRFSEMVPHFKASMYDYIVFDMPPLDESCAALAIAGSVDKVLLVVETGKTHREVVRRAYGELVGARANVSCILNKTPSNGSSLPRRTLAASA